MDTLDLSNIADVSLRDLQKLVEARVPEGYEANEKFYHGDHWQDGGGWVGPRPRAGDMGYEYTWALIKQAFESKNVIKEGVNSHADGVLGEDPDWGATPVREISDEEDPTADEQEMIDVLTAALQTWWNDQDLQKRLQKALRTALYGYRAVLRLYIPRGVLEESEEEGLQVPAGAFEKQLGRLHVDVLPPDQALIYTDPDTKREIGIYVYKKNRVTYAELTYLDDDDQTVIRRMDSAGSEEKVTYDLGGRLTMVSLERELLITPQVRQTQRSLNMTKTMMSRNEVVAGFLERIITNAQLPGEFEDEQEGENPNPKYTPASHMEFGGGTTNILQGHPIFNEEGNLKDVTTPQVIYREPSDPEVFIKGKESKYDDLLDEMHQTHKRMQGENQISAESRLIAREEFSASLNDSKTAVDAAGRALLRAATAMASALSGQSGRFDALRIFFRSVVNTGPLTSAEREAIIAQEEASLLSMRTAMARLGVEDIDAEMARINTATRKAAEIFEVMDRSGIRVPAITSFLLQETMREQFPDIDENVLSTIEAQIEEAEATEAQGNSIEDLFA